MEHKSKDADNPILSLTRVEESVMPQVFLAVLWAGGLTIALSPMIGAAWFVGINAAIFLPRTRLIRSRVISHNGFLSQFFGIVSACIWGIAPFLVWKLGGDKYATLAIVMIGIGFLQAISQYRDSPRPALLVAIPYIMICGWIISQSRMGVDLVILVIALASFAAILAGMVYSSSQTKKKLLAYKDEQDRLLTELEAAKVQAEKANQAKSVFLANISHELRTPLNGILGLSDILMHENMEKGRLNKVSLIHESGQNLLALLNDVLDISKIEAEGVDIESITFDFDEFLKKSYAFWSPVANKKNIQLSFQKQKGMPAQLLADPTRIRQCLNNLVSNALKFTPENGNVMVTATGKDENGRFNLQLAVQDDGIGIDVDTAANLFQPFAQGDSAISRKFGGTGLGLAISRNLCRLMDGDIVLDSVIGKGATFTMNIMADIAAVQPVVPVHAGNQVAIAECYEGLSCLVVEDNKINAEVLLLMLEPYNFDVTVVVNGRQALQALQTQRYDLVLMDLQMPLLGGLEATSLIRRSDKAFKNVPIIAMTANAMEGGRERCFSVGMNGYLTKPLSQVEIRDAIKDLKLKPAKRPMTLAS